MDLSKFGPTPGYYSKRLERFEQRINLTEIRRYRCKGYKKAKNKML